MVDQLEALVAMGHEGWMAASLMRRVRALQAPEQTGNGWRPTQTLTTSTRAA